MRSGSHTSLQAQHQRIENGCWWKGSTDTLRTVGASYNAHVPPHATTESQICFHFRKQCWGCLIKNGQRPRPCRHTRQVVHMILSGNWHWPWTNTLLGLCSAFLKPEQSSRLWSLLPPGVAQYVVMIGSVLLCDGIGGGETSSVWTATFSTFTTFSLWTSEDNPGVWSCNSVWSLNRGRQSRSTPTAAIVSTTEAAIVRASPPTATRRMMNSHAIAVVRAQGSRATCSIWSIVIAASIAV